MKPYLFLVARPAGPVADDEFAALAGYGGLAEGQLERFDLAGLEPVPDLDRYSGVIISGSPYNYLDPADSKPPEQVRIESALQPVCEEIVARDLPAFGICFGLQMLALAAGGTLTTAHRERISAPVMTMTEHGLGDDIYGPLGATFRNFVGHSEAIDLVPESMTVLAASELVPVQAARIGRNVYGTQYHPEIGQAGIRLRIANYSGVYYDSNQRDLVLEECGSASTDHSVLARFVARYAR